RLCAALPGDMAQGVVEDGDMAQGPPPAGSLYGVAVSKPGSPWAVGDGGLLLRGSGRSWAQAMSPTDRTLRGVWAADTPERVAVVGESFTVFTLKAGGIWQSFSRA